MTSPFKRLFIFFFALSISVELNAQDSIVLRSERFESLKNMIKEVNYNSNKLTDKYKKSDLLSSKVYGNLKDKIRQLDKVLGSKNTLDSFYIRTLKNKYEGVTQKIIDLTDTLQKNLKIITPKAKELIDKFHNSYFRAEASIDSYDDLNWNNKRLLFRIYTKAHASPM